MPRNYSGNKIPVNIEEDLAYSRGAPRKIYK
jgi:hypothetical protein